MTKDKRFPPTPGLQAAAQGVIRRDERAEKKRCAAGGNLITTSTATVRRLESVEAAARAMLAALKAVYAVTYTGGIGARRSDTPDAMQVRAAIAQAEAAGIEGHPACTPSCQPAPSFERPARPSPSAS